jgi:hypothetical protein
VKGEGGRGEVYRAGSGGKVCDSVAEDPDEFLQALLDDVAREDSDIVAFIKAYFDESDRSNAGGCDIFAVAGVAFTRNRAEGFAAAWRKVFGPLGGFHMRDLAHRTRNFEHLSKAETGDLLKKAVSIVNRYRLVVVACSCRVSDFEALSRVKFHGFNSPYAICAESCMIQLGSWLKAKRYPSRVAYFFETGHRHASDATHLLSRVSEDPSIKQAYRYRSHSFVDKQDAIALQAADLVAWEYAKFQDDTEHQGKRKARASYLALADSDPESFLVRHRDKADLQGLMDYVLYAAHVPEPGDD